MPLTTIELRRGTSTDFRRRVSGAIHTAMTEVLGIPDDDRFHVFHELDEGSMLHEPVLSASRGARICCSSPSRSVRARRSRNERSMNQWSVISASKPASNRSGC